MAVGEFFLLKTEDVDARRCVFEPTNTGFNVFPIARSLPRL